MKIGIIYLTTEAYNKFWKDFYCICEQYFCVDAEKEYKLFTDSPESIGCASSANVYVRQIEDLGWIVNTSYKSEYICSIHEELGKYDYDYYINETIRNNDPKAVGPFILASLEWERLQDVKVIVNRK